MTPLDNAPDGWLGHPFTCRLRKHLEQQREIALTGLLAACRQSNDPAVARKYTMYDQLCSFLGQLGKENDLGSTDDGD